MGWALPVIITVIVLAICLLLCASVLRPALLLPRGTRGPLVRTFGDGTRTGTLALTVLVEEQDGTATASGVQL